MSWKNLLVDSLPSTADLPLAVEESFRIHRESWPLFREGEAALASIRTKTLVRDGAEVLVQSNPGRRRSTHAKTDVQSVAARKCFLCPQNLPSEERGIGFGQLVILPNPYPILSHHCTIPERTHRPQQLGGNVGIMLELARRMGPRMVVFYNGPHCGASAPDHFHFQSCRAEGIPLISQLEWSEFTKQQRMIESFGRRIFLSADASAEVVQKNIAQTVGAMRQLAAPNEEPLLNLVVLHREGRYASMLFPRAVHRPACYFAAGDACVAISPAALEMAGVLVVAEPDHFDRVDAEVAHCIYSEVSLDHKWCSAIAAKISG